MPQNSQNAEAAISKKSIRPGISNLALKIAKVIQHDDGSLVIPYFGLDGTPTGFFRTRLARPRPNGQKYDQPKDSGSHVYLPIQLDRLLEENTGLIIPPGSLMPVEGEFKAMALACERVPAIGLPGLYACKAIKDENGRTVAREVLADLLEVIRAKQIKRVYFLGDADTAHNFLFAYEAWTLAMELQKLGVEVFLPRLDIGGPKGIDDVREEFLASGKPFKQFLGKLIEEAITMDPLKTSPQLLALWLLNDQKENIKKLSGTDQWPTISPRLIKVCAWAKFCRHKDQVNAERLLDAVTEILELPKTTVESAVNEAIENLRKKFKQSDPEPQPAENHSGNEPSEESKVYIEFLKPSEIKAYQPPPKTLLVGDNHIVRGGVFVVAGPPGVGKSRCSVALAEAGATRLDWLGQKVHTRFPTIIVQNENGRYRLKLEFAELDEKLLDQYLLISPPPPFGLCFNKFQFRDQLKKQIDLIEPGIVVIDPWNAVPLDDKAKDYREAFDLVRDVIPAGDDAPAIGIIAHTRKPLPNERTSGRALLSLLAGSYILASVPRTVWVLQHASDDVAESRVVVTCCKNNDGELGPRSVWIRDNGLWTPYQGFDWNEWDNPDPNKNIKSISERTMEEVFDNGNKALKLSEACNALMKLTGKKKTVCYAALDQKGPFANSLEFDPKTRVLRWILKS